MIFKVRLILAGNGAGTLRKLVNLEPFLQTCPRTPSSQFKTEHSILNMNRSKRGTHDLMLKLKVTWAHVNLSRVQNLVTLVNFLKTYFHSKLHLSQVLLLK